MMNDVQKTFLTGEFAALFEVKKIHCSIMIRSICLSRQVFRKMGTVIIHLNSLIISWPFNLFALFNFRSSN